ncbi:MAG: hypothetical protein ACPLRU_01130, partial [Desulfofundulus sp.]
SQPAAMAAWKHVLEGIETAPLWKRALAVIQSYAAENVHRIAGMEPVGMDGRTRTPSSGYVGGLVNIAGQKAIGFFPNAFDEAIKKHLGIEGTTIREGLLREGVIIPDKAGKSSRNQRIRPAGGESFTARVICIPVELVFPPDAEEETRGSVAAGSAPENGDTDTGPGQFSWDDLPF